MADRYDRMAGMPWRDKQFRRAAMTNPTLFRFRTKRSRLDLCTRKIIVAALCCVGMPTAAVAIILQWKGIL